jgi:hypothetical protein
MMGKEQGAGSREQGAGSWGQGAGSKEQGARFSSLKSWNPESKIQSLESKTLDSRIHVHRSSFIVHRFLWFSISLLCLCLLSCGHKTAVRPPEWTSPEAIGDLALDIDNKKNVVVLKWGRPQEYTDGSDMDDLGGFVVLRATEEGQGKESAFTQMATITVEDRDTDTQLSAGVLYRYRVQAVTLDGYSSGLSNTVELVWKGGTVEAPAPVRVPAKR